MSVTPHQLRRALGDAPMGLAIVDRTGTIEHIEGGGLREVDTSAGAWLGRSLAGTAWWRRGIAPALMGETVMLTGTDPVGGETQQVILYVPRANGKGGIVGVSIWWFNVPSFHHVTVDVRDEDTDHG